LAGLLQPGKSLEAKLLAVSTDAEKIYAGGYWDNSALNATTDLSRLKHIPAHYGMGYSL